MQVPKVVLLIFVSGKVVLTGAKRVEGNSLQLLLLSLVAIVTHSCSCAFVVDLFPDVLKAFKIIYPVLYKYRKQTSSGASSSGSSSGGGSAQSGNQNALTNL